MSRKLAVEDIADLRAYERERDRFRQRIIELKKTRRIAVGPFVTVLFENRDTIRFQVQEMARAENITTDRALQAELDVYNVLIPEPGSLSATVFIELTSKPDLEEWLAKLVGIERAVQLRLAEAPPSVVDVVGGQPDTAHQQHLTREAVTASVHYVRFDLSPCQTEAFRRAKVSLTIDHPEYSYATELADISKNALLNDLLG